MTEHNSDQLKEIIDNIRNDFFKKHEKNIQDNEFHELDLKRINENDGWVRAFYWISGRKHNETVIAIYDALKWRKEFGANDLMAPNSLPFRDEMFTKNGIVMKGTDKQGVSLLTLNVKMHKKGEYPHEELCKFIAYNLETHYKFDYDHKLVVVFNLNGAGYSNMDMDLIKFVVNCLKSYYPRITGYTVVFQMPFIFEAVWKVIKLMLSPGVTNLVKFVNKSTIREFIDDEEYLSNL